MAAFAPTPDERTVTLCGTCNVRDLGGLPLARGGLTARGRVYRGDVPLRLDPADGPALAALGVTTVVDLREPGEVTTEPNALTGHGSITVVHVDVWEAVRPLTPADQWDLEAWYLTAIDHAGPAFARAFTAIADADGAALFHCTAGKDRTGLLAALLLETVGVPRETILHDYALTHDRIEPVRARLLAQAEARGISREDFARVLGAAPAMLARTLDHVDARHGGATAYLSRAGVADEAVERLAVKLAPP
jgi:protein-tyrosine phosphatase